MNGALFRDYVSVMEQQFGSLVLLMSIFGAKIAIVYVVIGLVIAVVGGMVIEKMYMENHVAEFIRNVRRKNCRWISTRSCSTGLWITLQSIRMAEVVFTFRNRAEVSTEI